MKTHACGVKASSQDVHCQLMSFPKHLDMAGSNSDLLVQDANGDLVWADDVDEEQQQQRQSDEEASCGTVVDVHTLSDCMSTC
jgi:hypothetical protein